MKTAIFCAAAIFAAAITYAQPKIGQPAPELAFVDMLGKKQSLLALKGKIVLVDFWASWCAPCRKSNKQIGPIYDLYRKSGFEIVGISLDEDEAAWKKAVKADKINWIQYREDGGWNAKVALQWGIEQLPTSFLLDSTGRVISVDPSAAELENVLRAALKN